MSGDDEIPYEVGYGKPPVATRFQKGQSGNSRGRPKKVHQQLDPGELLEAIDNEEVTVTDNGKCKRMAKAEIQFRQLFTKAIRGDMNAARLVIRMASEYFAPQARGTLEYELIGKTEAARRFGPSWRRRVDELNAILRSSR